LYKRRELILHITLSHYYISEVNKHGTILTPVAGYTGSNLCSLARYVMKITPPCRIHVSRNPLSTLSFRSLNRTHMAFSSFTNDLVDNACKDTTLPQYNNLNSSAIVQVLHNYTCFRMAYLQPGDKFQ
jgi:hypothetical protein